MGRNVIYAETPAKALTAAAGVTPAEGLICVSGSLHLVGAIREILLHPTQS
jgi:folylpolyglutamate synthase/dihydropteroate synthase